MIPDKIKEKVEQFRDNRDLYKSTDFKEHQLEQQFINPFWEALGWDVANDQGLAHGYQDVIVQPGLRIDGTMKAPDYVFRAGSEKKFYLEVKAPKVNIAKDPAPAHQLKR